MDKTHEIIPLITKFQLKHKHKHKATKHLKVHKPHI
jgi:hypothetical protein